MAYTPITEWRGELFRRQLRRALGELDSDVGVKQAEAVVLSTYGDTVSVAAKGKNLNKFGRSSNVDTGQRCTIAQWPGAAQYNETFVFTNAIDSVASSDATDTQVIIYEGHTISGGDLSFTDGEVTLTGQTPAALPTPVRVLNRWRYKATGVVGVEQPLLAGDMSFYDSSATTVTAGVPDTPEAVKMYSPAGSLGSKKAQTSISAGDYWFLTNLEVSITGGSPSAKVEFQVEIRDVKNGGNWAALGAEISLDNGNQTAFSLEFNPLRIVPKNHDCRVVATSSANNVAVTADLQGVLAAIV